MKDEYRFVVYVPEDEKEVWKRERRLERRIMIVNIITVAFVAIMAFTALVCILAKNGIIASWR
jgi:hypothetical protein